MAGRMGSSCNSGRLRHTEFKESPYLAEKVVGGELPPVEERLPKNPLVIVPYDRVGQYGGTLTVASTGVNAYNDITHARIPNLFTDNPGVSEVVPEIAEGFELLDNNTRLVLKLREGLKWSDGHPFTADDILYWYEHEVLHPDISVWAELLGSRRRIPRSQDHDYTVEMLFKALSVPPWVC